MRLFVLLFVTHILSCHIITVTIRENVWYKYVRVFVFVCICECRYWCFSVSLCFYCCWSTLLYVCLYDRNVHMKSFLFHTNNHNIFQYSFTKTISIYSISTSHVYQIIFYPSELNIHTTTPLHQHRFSENKLACNKAPLFSNKASTLWQ